MKIAAADDLTAERTGAYADEDQGVIRGTVEFDSGDLAGGGQGVAHGAVHLRRAAQAVGILHPRIPLYGTMRFADLAARVEAREVARRLRRARVRPHLSDARIECARTAAKRVE